MTKIIRLFIASVFYRREVVQQSLYDPFVELCKHRFVMQSLQNPTLCSSTILYGGAIIFTAVDPRVLAPPSPLSS
jgi:hypothetical protein